MLRIRILDRYIFRELMPPFFLSMTMLTFVMFIQRMFKLAELVVSKGATFISTVKLLAYIMPNFLVITIPMSLLVATLTAFARLSSDSEITAMKASRLSLYGMLRPVMVLSFLAFLATAATSLVLLPGANEALKVQLFDMVKSRAMVGIEPGVFSNTFDGMVIYVDKMKSLDDMEGIFISDERSARDPYAVIAQRGKLIADPQSYNVTLAMEKGTIHAVPQKGQNYSLIAFDSGRLYLDINHALLPKKKQEKDFNEISTPELIKEYENNKAQDKPTKGIESELHQRFSIPFACLLLGLIGAPLGIRRSRSGKSASIAIALAVFFVYYVILATGKNLAENGKLPIAVGYWLPNIVTAIGAAALVIKRGREINFGIVDRFAGIFRTLTGKRKKLT